MFYIPYKICKHILISSIDFIGSVDEIFDNPSYVVVVVVVVVVMVVVGDVVSMVAYVSFSGNLPQLVSSETNARSYFLSLVYDDEGSYELKFFSKRKRQNNYEKTCDDPYTQIFVQKKYITYAYW